MADAHQDVTCHYKAQEGMPMTCWDSPAALSSKKGHGHALPAPFRRSPPQGRYTTWQQLWHDMHVRHVCAEQRPKALPVQQHIGASCPAFPTRFCCHPGHCRWMICMMSVQVTAVKETCSSAHGECDSEPAAGLCREMWGKVSKHCCWDTGVHRVR